MCVPKPCLSSTRRTYEYTFAPMTRTHNLPVVGSSPTRPTFVTLLGILALTVLTRGIAPRGAGAVQHGRSPDGHRTDTRRAACSAGRCCPGLGGVATYRFR